MIPKTLLTGSVHSPALTSGLQSSDNYGSLLGALPVKPTTFQVKLTALLLKLAAIAREMFCYSENQYIWKPLGPRYVKYHNFIMI